MNENHDGARLALFNYLLGLGDDLLILGHRLSEWCGHAPVIEEDIALSNIALDCLGGANAFLQFAGETEGLGRSEDDLAFFRDAIQFKNYQITELPIGDFAFTIIRQFLFSSYNFILFGELQKSRSAKLASIAAKSYKEVKYHLRHTGEWVLRLGDGTEESHFRMQRALDDIWIYTGELFLDEGTDSILFESGYVPESRLLKPLWQERVEDLLSRATLPLPVEDQYLARGGRKGNHTEYLGHLLSEMQILARSYPGAKW
ncbi:MAG: phenylacetate-CoA oxygenase subunit PaaC [Ignavibacteria bacterium]|jgi:ring-1,2-phenylacetyl-CoA epoxidase subunit PaaC|nr:phenylacetate-CoA oxygenase subunit PaaC [Ignavibacteria bacterium]MCU7503286.1 phenylacetate-CoA oxygenase subunit PaaC [Ignavibacteria bacterium]MCU7515768.1 phenylacetate-CoA oxygenase subunit PaaC [Ignavibacteria bacterium]